MSPPDEPLIPPHGNYHELLSFQKAEVIYDLTFRFAHKYLARGDRTIDQMIQAARSGKKNILEGSEASGTSKETELRLTGVANASLGELLDDYADFLRVRDLPIWDKSSKQAQFVRRLGRKTPQTFELYREFFETRPAEIVANIALCLIHQTKYLLDQQLLRLEQDFIEQGGLRERMTRVRLQYRSKSHGTHESHETHKRPPKKTASAVKRPASRVTETGGRSATTWRIPPKHALAVGMPATAGTFRGSELRTLASTTGGESTTPRRRPMNSALRTHRRAPFPRIPFASRALPRSATSS